VTTKLDDIIITAHDIVTSIYCGDLDPFLEVLLDALHKRRAVCTGAPDKGPVVFYTRIMHVDGKKVLRVTYK
jgi:hypothetical protein